MQKASCAIMFADVSGSTRLYDDLGDDVAKKIIDKCLGCLQIVTETHKGIVVKKIGDELMCRFDSAAAAISAARVSQSEIQSLRVDENISLSIRAGIHFGAVIEDENDIFGDAVNVAARMAGIAKAGQIITTQSSVDELPSEMSGQVRQVDFTRVKGKQEKMAVYEVLWDQKSEVTKVATELLSRAASKTKKLELRMGEQRLTLVSENSLITIGRETECDFVVNTALSSRKHAVCELRRDKFVISDQGTNGTYVKTANGDEVYLRREELILQGQGTISLGQPCAETDADLLIHFEC